MTSRSFPDSQEFAVCQEKNKTNKQKQKTKLAQLANYRTRL